LEWRGILQESGGAEGSWVGKGFGETVGGICLLAYFPEDPRAG